MGTRLGAPAAAGIVYPVALGLAELAGLIAGEPVGVAAQCVLIAVLLGHAALRPSPRLDPFLVSLAVVSLLLVLSAALPGGGLPVPVRTAIVGAPVLLAVGLALRLPGVLPALGCLRPRSWAEQGRVALLGLPSGLLVFAVLRPDPAGRGLVQVVLFALLLTVFGGLMEELVFRGLVQQTATRLLGGRAGLAVSSAMFAVAYLGAGPPAAVLAIAAIGLLLGWCAQRTGSITGVVAAHALTSILVFLALPRLL